MTKPSSATLTPPDTQPVSPLEARIIAKREECLNTQKAIQQQLVGISNQIYILDQLLNPQPAPVEQPIDPDAPPPLEPGTI